MHKTSLRKVGGSVMMSVPSAFLDQLKLQAGATVGLSIHDGYLVVRPTTRPKYTLSELLSKSDYSLPQSQEQREWIDAPPVGDELL